MSLYLTICDIVFRVQMFCILSTANLQIPGRRKNVCREIKPGNANNVVFYAILSHPSHMQFLLKDQNTKVTNTQLKISYSKHNVTYRLPYLMGIPIQIACMKPNSVTGK